MAHGGKRDGAGRKAGSPNKISGDVKEMILGALAEMGGVRYLVEQAKKNPNLFVPLLGKLVPTTVAGDAKNPLHSKIEMVIIDTGVPRDPESYNRQFSSNREKIIQ